ncbi:MAG: 6-phosphogluconolactonase [Hyphomonadaceae bacterium]|nr:6-phosphogluconolactonase [Hyphomonadaceae bacterium]
MTNYANIVKFDSLNDVHSAAYDFVEERLKLATANKRKTSLFLSGGSTPGPIYQNLSKAKLPWSRIKIAQVDDRWVPLSSKGSNAAMIKRTLLRHKAANAKFFRMKSRHKSPWAGQDKVNDDYSALPMDNSIAILGMGADGHVCSWFPAAKGLSNALDPANDNLVQAVTAKKSKVTGPYLDRITLTLSALKQCGSLLLIISGDEKQRVLNKALADPTSDLPVGHLLRSCGNRLTIMMTGS